MCRRKMPEGKTLGNIEKYKYQLTVEKRRDNEE